MSPRRDPDYHRTTGILGCRAGVGGGVPERRVRGIVPSQGAAASSLGIFHPGSRRPERSERARFVSRPAPGMFPRKLSAPRPEPPPSLAAPPAQRVAQARQCCDRRFVLRRMLGQSAKARFPKRPPRALEAGFGSQIWGAPSVRSSSPKGLEAQGAFAPSFGLLEKGPTPSRPHMHIHVWLPRCRSRVAGRGGTGRGREGRLHFWPLAWIQVERA